MKLQWLGHASFLLTSEGGTRVITDPYAPGGGLSYGLIKDRADIVTVSHEHSDHNNATAIGGNPQVVKGVGTRQVKGIAFTGVSTYHDTSRGAQRGPNTVFCFALDGIRVCHLGDLGHVLGDQEMSEIGQVDLLLTPVGGNYTTDAVTATENCAKLKPRIVVPMHYRTAKCAAPIADAEEFLRGKANVRRVAGSQIEWKKEQLPKVTETVVLQHAL